MKSNIDITELIENFRDDQDVMPSTRRQYYNVVRLFFEWCFANDIDWRTVGISGIIRYKDYLFQSGRTARTIRYYMIILKIFWRWLENNGIDRNIASGIRLPHVEKNFSKRALQPEQFIRFIHSIDRSTQIGKRDYALFVLLFTTGLRSVSVESMNIGDIADYAGEKVVWYRNKGSRLKDRFKPLTETCLEALNDYLLTRGDIQDHWPLFATHSTALHGTRLSRQSMWLIFRTRLKAIGIQDKRITLHSIRHTFGVLSLKSVGIYETQLGLNHRSIETTKIYTHSADEKIILENKAGKAIEELI